MATNTTKLALSKPDGTDLVDVAVLNTNFDKIDAASGATICTSTTRPTSPWNGQVIFETDTLNALVYRTSTSSWNILGGSTVASNPPAGAGNGNFWWDSDNGKLYIYYNDGNSGQWVSVMPSQTAVDVTQNAIINGAFDFWQRGTSFSSPSFTADRFFANSDATITSSRQSFSVGQTFSESSVSPIYFHRIAKSAGGSFVTLGHRVENVDTFANKTVTLSFWAKADASATLNVRLRQDFGSGGSSFVDTALQTPSLTTSWSRISLTFSLASISGKTVGSNNHVLIEMFISGSSAVTLDVWGVQLEAGSVATAFRRNANSIQGELAACQRYYYRLKGGAIQNIYFATASFWSNNSFYCPLIFPVEMRATPTTSISNISHFFMLLLNANTTPTTFSATGSTTQGGFYSGTISAGSAGQSGVMHIGSGTNGWIEFNSEL